MTNHSCRHISLCAQGEIHRVRSDGTNRTEYAPAAILGSPVGLALDWITENLYYTNPSTQSIEVISLNICIPLNTWRHGASASGCNLKTIML